MTRVLVIARHAKAESYGTSDHERALTERGIVEARQAGAWLAERGLTPRLAIVSDAVRTQQTWEAMADEAGWPLAPSLDATLYEADTETALDLVRAIDDDVEAVLLLGHNPTVAYLAQVLDAGGSPELARTGFPTGAVAVFSYDGGWADLAEGTARLTDLRAEHR